MLRESSEQVDYETEDTLLIIHLSVEDGVTTEEAQKAVGKYCQSFPFAAVLPVQPLQYLPTDDNGVEVKFLRKKTEMKSAVNGGIRFFVQVDGDDGLLVTAKRNSIGQSVSKIMAEKLVVLAFVSGITGEEASKYGEAPLDTVQTKWLGETPYGPWIKAVHNT